jgi:enediyne biosynthesis protein E4
MMSRQTLVRKAAVTGGACLLVAAGVGILLRLAPRQAPAPAPADAALPVLPPIVAGARDWFEDITARSGIRFVHQLADDRIANIIESNGAGVVLFDYDGDGRPDIYLVNSGPLPGVTHASPGTVREPNRLYRNRGDGTFEDVTTQAGVGGAGYGTAAAAADYDNDGHTDLLVVGVGGCILYHNRGDGTFEDVTRRAGIASRGTGMGATFFDADNDGRLDLFIVNYLTFDPSYKLYYGPDSYPGPLSYQPEFNVLYHNRGDGTFEDVSQEAGIRIPGHRGMAVAAFDFNHDGYDDLYISDDHTPNLLLANDGKGHFRDVAVAMGVAFNQMGEAVGSMAATVGDCNGDGYPDMLVTRLGYGSLYLGSAAGRFDDRMMASGVAALTAQYVGWGGSFVDFDNDGDLDILIANGDPYRLVGWEPLLLENQGGGTFVDAAAKGGAFFKTRINGRGCAVGDVFNDGQMDVLVTALGDRPVLLRNRGLSRNHWIELDLEGTQSNRDGFGAQVTVTAGGRTWRKEARCPTAFLSQSDRRLHFGLGPNRTVDRIEIRWPSRQTQLLTNLPADQILKVREPGGRR